MTLVEQPTDSGPRGRRTPPTAGPRRERRSLTPYLYIAPFFVLFGVFGAFPILYTLWISLFEWNPIGDKVFVGGDNYATLLADPRFWNATGNTMSIWVLSTVPQLAIAIVLASALNHASLRMKTPLRMAILVPNVTSVIAVGIIFTQIFGRDYGLANWVLTSMGLDRVVWQEGTFTSHLAISSMVMWRWTGYNALIFLAALQAVPRSLYESASIDGAGGVRQFFSITVPQLRPTIIFAVIISTIGGLQVFAEPLVFAGQGAASGGSSRQFQTLALFLYEQGFRNFDFGYASAIAWALFLMVTVITLINLKLTSRIATDR